jgi:hypothetical protein
MHDVLLHPRYVVKGGLSCVLTEESIVDQYVRIHLLLSGLLSATFLFACLQLLLSEGGKEGLLVLPLDDWELLGIKNGVEKRWCPLAQSDECRLQVLLRDLRH